MYKIVIIVPYKDLIKEARSAFEEHSRLEFERGVSAVFDFECEIIFQNINSQTTHEKLQTADAVIARGVAYNLISQSIGSHAVELPISSYDLITLLAESREKFGVKKVTTIGSANMIDNAPKIGDILGIETRNYIIDDVVSREIVEQAVMDGCEVIVGSTLACLYAKELNMDCLLIRTGRQSLLQAISQAKNIARLAREEQEKNIYLGMVMDYSSEGILSADINGQIKIINQAAQNMIGLSSKDASGKPFAALSFPKRVTDWMQDKKTYLNEIVKYKSSWISLNKIPMLHNKQVLGNIIVFQDITRIQELEGIIRNKIFASGHVAKFIFEDIIYTSSVMQEKVAVAKQFAKADLSVLIVGESGTGKEMFAQSIHTFSSRKNRPFVAVNCGAIPENLLESELFGYVDGAFTGAAKGGKAGFFELAHGGTIFLDEVSELPKRLQGRLLRVLQEREIMRLGHDKVITIDVRVIAATNQNLKEMILKGEFREDLFFRINVLRLKVPPLRRRKEDIPLLAEMFFSNSPNRVQCEKISLEDEALYLLQQYDWQGNIRELHNICERLMVMAQNNVICVSNVLSVFAEEEIGIEPNKDNGSKSKDLLKSEMSELENQRILEAMKKFESNKVRASKYLGISRTTLWRKIKEMEQQV